jgi:hypothetical protein
VIPAAQSADLNHRLGAVEQLGELLSAGCAHQAEFEQQEEQILNG